MCHSMVPTGILFILILNLLSTSQAAEFKPHKYRNQDQQYTSVRIASVSVFPQKWQKEINWQRIETQVRQAQEECHAQVVVTPEGVLEGYVINQVNDVKNASKREAMIQRFIDLAEPLEGPYIRKATRLADELNIFFVLGFLEKREDKLFNTVILIDPEGDIIGRYSKTHFAQGYSMNPSCYLPGSAYPVYNTPYGKIGMMICYDRQLPENARILALKGAQVLLVPSYGSYDDGDGWNTAMQRTRAYENQCAYVFCHPKQSLLITRRGDIKAQCGQDEYAYFDVDTDPAKIKNRFQNRRPELYLPLAVGGGGDPE